MLVQNLKDLVKSDRQRKKYCMISLICRILKKNDIQMNLFTKQKQTHRLRELMVTRGEESGGGIVRELGTDMYTLL